MRGGRFVSGFSGEQFALPEAAAALRKTAKTPGRERVSISAVDPLNLAGILTPGEKVAAAAGQPAAVRRRRADRGAKRRRRPLPRALDARAQWEVKNLLIRRQRPGSYVQGADTAQ